ncbi:MAG: IS3 family transposase [Actinobacteria bacterium]|uniref:Unannotated protein n=1 Tax=freshwater metagenome TaxID=449393 RepID=A0A6J7UK78_9ZZZZ|nr:IS3 family transposase [Actinomycetota bacterium]MSY12213.1 IS3 family transposase [Actinomycetota bacterium]MSZ04357.1 IS3 family transposase [Actinomycetota bacterium]MTB07230.1 IS3 family transposase [Actinomycetota bacterium]
MIRFIDAHRHRVSGALRWGIEPICAVLQIAPSTYHAAKKRPPSARAVRDSELRPQELRVWEQNLAVYGADKVWDQLNKDGIRVARCTVERLMADMGLQGCRRGLVWIRTTEGDQRLDRPAGLVERQFRAPAPNRLWVADLTYVDWFNNRRLYGEIEPGPGFTTPAAFEADRYSQTISAEPAKTQTTEPRKNRGVSYAYRGADRGRVDEPQVVEHGARAGKRHARGRCSPPKPTRTTFGTRHAQPDGVQTPPRCRQPGTRQTSGQRETQVTRGHSPNRSGSACSTAVEMSIGLI